MTVIGALSSFRKRGEMSPHKRASVQGLHGGKCGKLAQSRVVETHRRKAPESSEWSAAELVVFSIKMKEHPFNSRSLAPHGEASYFPMKPFGVKQHP
jgi:hypothetical protein